MIGRELSEFPAWTFLRRGSAQNSRAEQDPLCSGISDAYVFCYGEGASASGLLSDNARDVVAAQELHGCPVVSASMDRGRALVLRG